jgi:hypothetical protein
MSDYAYDVLVYHDFSSSETPKLGEPFPGFEGGTLHVVAVGPPVHPERARTVVLAFGRDPMPEIQKLLDAPR